MEASIGIYGPTKIGKTTDVFCAFRKAFCLLYEPGGLLSVEANLGYTPDHILFKDLTKPYKETHEFVTKKLPGLVQQKGYKAIVMDTGSEFAARLLVANNTAFNDDGRKVYPKTTAQFMGILRSILNLGLWTVYIFHEQAPKQSESAFTRGGPKLPGKLVEDAPGLFSTIMRATYGTAGATGGVSRVYLCNPIDPQYIMGDRSGATGPCQDMDLRPILFRMMHPGKPLPAFPEKPIRVPEGTEKDAGGLPG